MALLGIRLEDKVHREFKVLCVRLGVNMSDVIRELIKGWIVEQSRQVDTASDGMGRQEHEDV